jgi:serine/threonine protein kinase
MSGRPQLLSVGSQLGPYRLEQKLAVGGTAEVWSAEEHLADGRPRLVALKLMLPTFVSEPGFVEIFTEEVGQAARLEHPNIVRVHGALEVEGQLVQSMELLDGLDLRRALSLLARRRQQFPVGAVLSIGAQLASALSYAHGLELVHRDVSPHNVMLTRAGKVKLLDFGLGRVFERRVRKPGMSAPGGQKTAYRAPEQALGVGVTAQSDIFSLGVVLWEMLAMQRLFRANSEPETLALVVAASIPPVESKRPEVPAEVGNLLHHMLEQRAPNRPSSMAEVWAVLARVVEQGAYPEATPAGLSRFLAQLFGEPSPAVEATSAVGADTGPMPAADITEPVPAPDFDDPLEVVPPDAPSHETPLPDPSGRTVAMAPLSTMALSANVTPTPSPEPSASHPGDAAPTMALSAPSVPVGSSSTPDLNTPSEGSRPAGFRLPTRSEIRRAIEEQPTMPVVADPRFLAMVGQGTGARAPMPRVERLTPTADGPLVPLDAPPVPEPEATSDEPIEEEPALAVHESSPDRLPAVPVSISAVPTGQPAPTSGPSRATIQVLVITTGALALLALALAIMLFLKD